MGSIRQMSPELAARVAAGEVVQGPWSVVKELVENALDAGATAIDVDLVTGGIRSIRVSDNGSGMDEVDAGLALLQHASSKTTSDADLDAIKNLGFRGEALFAIASSAHVTLETQQAGATVGSRAVSLFGDARRVELASRRPGTTVTVEHLFQRTPARLEFLGTPNEESGKVLRVCRDVALSRPSLAFRLHDGPKLLLDLPPAADSLARFAMLYGDAAAEEMIPMSGEAHGVWVQGWVTRPTEARQQARRTHFFVNGRPFQSFALKRIVKQAMGPLVTHGTPDAVLYIEMAPGAVDPNVSPDKTSIRFHAENVVYSVVYKAVAAAVADLGGLGESVPRSTRGGPSTVADGPIAGRAAWAAYDASLSADTRAFASAAVEERPDSLFDAATPTPTATGIGSGARLPEAPAVLLQMARTFIVAEVEGGLLYVDQHSAHERILYEAAAASLANGAADVQPLLIPDPVPLPDVAARLQLEDALPVLASLGFTVEPSGPTSFWVTAAPSWIGGKGPGEIIARALRDAAERKGQPSLTADAMTASVLRRIACHSAVRSGQALSETEMRALWQQLRSVNLALSDVHGRPGAVLVTHAEIARRLNRGGIA